MALRTYPTQTFEAFSAAIEDLESNVHMHLWEGLRHVLGSDQLHFSMVHSPNDGDHPYGHWASLVCYKPDTLRYAETLSPIMCD